VAESVDIPLHRGLAIGIFVSDFMAQYSFRNPRQSLDFGANKHLLSTVCASETQHTPLF